MRRFSSFIAVTLLLPVAFLAIAPAQAAPLGTEVQYASGLNWPTALAIVDDGRVFFAEGFTGQIRVIDHGVLNPVPLYTLPNAYTGGDDTGVTGLALAPGFPANPWVYTYYTYLDLQNATIVNRIVRILVEGNVGTSLEVVLSGIFSSSFHNGGVIAFGPDGKLYALVGDFTVPESAQNLSGLNGKVLRLNPDGSVPTDNPFYGNSSANPHIYTYGHRNMFGIAFNPVTGRAYVTENGPECNDEINLLIPGRNYGWGPRETCTTPPRTPLNTNQDGPDPVLPIAWFNPQTAVTNAVFQVRTSYGSMDGGIVFGEWIRHDLRRLQLAPPNYDRVTSDRVILKVAEGIIDVEAGTDGTLWFTTPTSIFRLATAMPWPLVSSGPTENSDIIVGSLATTPRIPWAGRFPPELWEPQATEEHGAPLSRRSDRVFYA